MNAASRSHNRLPTGSFLQDVATFYTAYTSLDGAQPQKVLAAARPFALSGWRATKQGLFLYTEAGEQILTERDGVPLATITCVAQGADGAVWIGGSEGAARLREGIWRYFAGKRWLPDNQVTDIAVDDEGKAWITTSGGLVCIASIAMTWQQKAAHYEEVTAARHNRNGFVTECLLTTPGEAANFLYEASDNDGLWTALYLCGECFRYAVTGEETARSLARKSFKAMLDLVRLTGIPGFPARAILRRNERAQLSEPRANWLPSPVDPEILYKTDTSSDEIDGHYLAWFVYATLVADVAEKAVIAATCHAVTTHILDNDYTLVGSTGKRTSWGVWTPSVLNDDPEWLAERGLNSLAMLSHLRVALHLCPCERFERAYRSLIEKYHYAYNTIRQKVLSPEGEDNHSDDELAACAYYPLLMLETDPHLRAIYLLSLENTQKILRPTRSPFYNVIYSACTGRPCDGDAVREWLEDAPLDLRDWTMINSRRPDVVFQAEPDRFGKRQLAQPLPPGEKAVMKWNQNPYLADGGTDGAREMDGAFWLLPYWMGRYYGVISG